MKPAKHFLLLFALFSGAFLTLVKAQTNDFSFSLEKVEIAGMPGFQSSAVARMDGKIVVLGGRTDGLHRRQPFASFAADGSNTLLLVLDPVAGTFVSVPVEGLPAAQKEQMLATNIQFYQEGPWWFLAGGYGYSPTADDHITHPLLTIVRLDSLVEAVETGAPIAPWFQSIPDEQMAVTGGQLVKQGDVFYLAGGHRFEGRYNPMNHPTFVQTYTNSIRRFTATHTGGQWTISHLPDWTDEVNLQRRDYNLLPQVFPQSGKIGFTLFSGVFTPISELPYLNSVDFDSSGYAVNNTFQQRLNQYHCAKAAFYDASSNRMYAVFFGGIAQFFINSNGTLQQDDNVPFVRTIGRITRQADGSAVEEKIGDMPGLLGAGAEFVPLATLPLVEGTDIIRLDLLTGDSVLIGYVLGGIESDLPNVFFDAPEDQSRAHTAFYKIWLKPGTGSSGIRVPALASPLRKPELSPNPARNLSVLQFSLDRPAQTSVVLQTPNAQTIHLEDLGTLAAGDHRLEFRLDNFPNGIYPVTIFTDQFIQTLHLVITR